MTEIYHLVTPNKLPDCHRQWKAVSTWNSSISVSLKMGQPRHCGLIVKLSTSMNILGQKMNVSIIKSLVYS